MTEVPDLSARLTALEDREAVRELIARYGPLADCGDARALAELWTEDGEYVVTGFATARGHSEIAALIDGPVHRQLMADGCAHILGPAVVTVVGDAATARCHSLVLRHEAGSFVVHRVSANRWTFRRTPQGWRAVRRENALLDGTEAARALLQGV